MVFKGGAPGEGAPRDFTLPFPHLHPALPVTPSVGLEEEA